MHRWNSCEAVWKTGKRTQSHTFVLLGQQLARSSRASHSDPLQALCLPTPFSHHVTARRQLKHVIGANWEVYLLSSCRRRERGTQLEMERLCGTWPANVDRGEHCRVWSARLAGGITFTASNWPSTGSACVRAPERAAARPLRPSHRQDYIAGGQSEPFDVASAKRDRAGDDFPPSPTRRFSHFLKRANANRRPPRNGRTTGRRNELPPLFLSSH